MNTMKTIKSEGAEFWNANPCGGRWQNYHEFMTWIQRTEPYIFSILEKYEWQGRNILEVGCGQGTTLNYLPRFGATVFGVDMSMQSLLGARSGAAELGHQTQIRLAQADAEKLPFADSSYDIIISIGVLHHTMDTAGGVCEIHRILKPGGRAIVMLYRSGNPKWWMTCLLRGYSWLADRITGKKFLLATRLRQRQEMGSSKGTALLELFGVPILKAFSNRQSRRMFAGFSEVKITNYSPGFYRLVDILPPLHVFSSILKWLDRATRSMWGFYQVIEAEK